MSDVGQADSLPSMSRQAISLPLEIGRFRIARCG